MNIKAVAWAIGTVGVREGRTENGMDAKEAKALADRRQAERRVSGYLAIIEHEAKAGHYEYVVGGNTRVSWGDAK